MVPLDSDGVSPAPPYSGYRYRESELSLTGLSPSLALLSQQLQLTRFNQMSRPYNPGLAVTNPVWAPPRSLATTWGIIVIFFSCRYLDVSVPGVCHRWSSQSVPDLFQPGGCPIRKSAGLTGMCPSPELIAAYRVLRRLSDPRHPPCALAYFAFVTLLLLRTACPLPGTKRATLRFCYPLRQRTCITLVFSDVVEELLLYSSIIAESRTFRPLIEPSGPAWTRTTDLYIISVAL